MRILFLFLLLVLAPGLAGAADPRLSLLPEGVQEFLRMEQELIDMKGGDPRFLKPRTHNQNNAYRPESRPVMELKTYWVDEADFGAVESPGFPPELKEDFVRTVEGRRQYRLLVHPESEEFYRPLLKNAVRAEDFLGSPTASSRSLVAWKPGKEKNPFFAKLSLAVNIGEVDRTINNSEVVSSVGISKLLHGARGELPEAAEFVSEPFGLMPRNAPKGGMILRLIPEKLKEGPRLIPLFAYYGAEPNGKPPLLARLIRESGEDPETYVRRNIVRPFLDQWVDLALQGITMEAHGQNTLGGLDANGRPDGTFAHRDYGGFNIDLDYRKKAGLYVPDDLPFVTSLAKDYYQADHQGNLAKGIDVYFSKSYLWAQDQRLNEWAKRGWITAKNGQPISTQKFLFKELEDSLFRKTGRKCSIGHNPAMITACVLAARNSIQHRPAAIPRNTGCPKSFASVGR